MYFLGETRILPVWYSTNLFTLLPQEESNVVLGFETEQPNQSVYIRVSGWNVQETFIPIPNRSQNITTIN